MMWGPDTHWRRPPLYLSLGRGEIHLWRFALDLSSARLEQLTKSLWPEERERAARFHFDQDRNRFCAGRGLLRATLGQYLRTDPGQIALAYSQYGKPELAAQSCREGIRFNLSHSGGTALLAVVRGGEVGVDIEQIRRDIDTASLASSAFSVPEIAELADIPASQRHNAFYGFWTRKESYLKAVGTGLLCPLKEFAVSLTDDQITLLTEAGDTRGIAPERTTPIDCGEGYAGALTVTGDSWRLKQFMLQS